MSSRWHAYYEVHTCILTCMRDVYICMCTYNIVSGLFKVEVCGITVYIILLFLKCSCIDSQRYHSLINKVCCSWCNKYESHDVCICECEFIVILDTVSGFTFIKWFSLLKLQRHTTGKRTYRMYCSLRTKYWSKDTTHYSTFAISSTGFKKYKSGGFVKDRKMMILVKELVSCIS